MGQWTLRGLRPVAAGTVAPAGLAGAAVTARVLWAYLFEVGSLDAVLVAGCASLFLAGSVVASYLPTRRILKLDPATVLRTG